MFGSYILEEPASFILVSLAHHEVLTGGKGRVDVDEEHTPTDIPSHSPHSAARRETASFATAQVSVHRLAAGG